MKTHHNKIILTLVLLGAGVLLYEGWKLFWFLTDDAFIAFRYVSNSILGYGYAWNPPPFRPVEGYTSFLWVVILDFIWRVFDLQPPDVVNYLSLGFSFLTLFLVTWFVMRMKLNPAYDRFRFVFLCLILIGTLFNRTFLAWTSSGMETAMFNFFFTLWIFIAVLGRKQGYAWLAGLTGSAALVYLSRPDGMVVIFFTLLILFFSLFDNGKQKKVDRKWFLAASPLLIVAAHLFWRKSYYGEWLPNTYYAKVGTPWPEAGARYLASFILEYVVWVWLLLFIISLFAWLRRHLPKFRPSKEPGVKKEADPGLLCQFHSLNFLSPVFAVLALMIHIGYYTFVVGGDHFEYRIYSYLVPLIFLSFLWMLHTLNCKPGTAMAAFCLFILLSLPIPWTHWQLTKNKNTREETHIMIAPISEKFASALHWYAGFFDDLQSWLIQRHICMRHQEHKVFYEYHKSLYPSRAQGEQIKGDDYPVLVTATVGVPGWVLPHVIILDEYGLNDYIIARSPFRKRAMRLMAHGRVPPPGYIESFQPNVSAPRARQLEYRQRQRALTTDDIIAIENYWRIEIKRLRETIALDCRTTNKRMAEAIPRKISIH